MRRRWEKVWSPWVPRGEYAVTHAVHEYVSIWSRLRPSSGAISYYGVELSYQQLDDLINRTASLLRRIGVRKGDHVGIYMQNCPQFVIAYLATHRCGAVAVPINPMYKHLELEHQVNDAQIKAIFSQYSLLPEVHKINSTCLKYVIATSLRDFVSETSPIPIPLDINLDIAVKNGDILDMMKAIEREPPVPIQEIEDIQKDLALLQYTGGTTGLPKGAMITHYALSYASVANMFWNAHRYDDVFLGVTPFFHIMGQVALMCVSVVAGARLVVLSRFDPEAVCRAIDHYKCTFWVAPPTAVIAVANFPERPLYDFASLRIFWTGGAPISPEVQQSMREIAPRAALGEGYGLTETVCHGGAVTPLFRHKPGFVGVPHVNDIAIVDSEKMEEKEPYEEGEIAIRGPILMTGYWNKPEESEACFKDGWFLTGDMGKMDEEGYVQVLGRKKEMIKCSGYSVFPAELESLLYRHPAVKEVAVVGVPDEYRGESPKAYIVLKPEFKGRVTEADILTWCKDNIAAYKRPRYVEFLDELPKSAAGKILKRLLARTADFETQSTGNNEKI